MATAANILALGLETVSNKIVDLTDGYDTLASEFSSVTDTEIGQWGYRIPIKLRSGGAAGKVLLNGGTTMSGTDPVYTYMRMGYVDSTFSVRLTHRQIQLANSEKTVGSVMQEVMKDIIDMNLKYRNSWICGDGTGKYTNGCTAVTSTTGMTFSPSTDSIGTSRCFLGMDADVWASNGSTKRGTVTVTEINHALGTLTHSGIAGLAVGDFLVVRDVDVYGPATLTSGNATYPSADIGTGANGFGIDSYIHGLDYYHSDATIPYVLGMAKATNSRLTAVAHTASSGATLSWDMAHVIRIKLARSFGTRMGDNVQSKYRCFMSPEQRYQLALTQSNSVNIQLPAGTQQKLQDMSVEMSDEFNFDGFPAKCHSVIDKAKVHFVNKANWGRVKCGGAGAADFQFFKGGPGGTDIYRPVINTSSGMEKFIYQLVGISSYDHVCHSPGEEGYITGLTVPTIFTS